MYKRFIRWASDRLADDGIIAFITNRAYLEARQDDGFRKVAAGEFTDIYVMDLGSDVRRNPKISGTTHNVFGIQTGVAIAFLVREKSRLGECNIHYARREDAEIARDKLAYLKGTGLETVPFESITPDGKSNWLNQSNSNFRRLMPLADRQTNFAKSLAEERAVFRLFSNGVITDRDDWVYDFDRETLGRKVRAFINSYEEARSEHGGAEVDNSVLPRSIKWTRDLKRQLVKDVPNVYDRNSITPVLYRPFVTKSLYFHKNLNEMQYQMPRIFPTGASDENTVLCFRGLGTNKPFDVIAVGRLAERQILGNAQCLPLYRYTEDGERVSNITEWGLRQVREHYGEDGITAEEIFAYTYAVLHDPAYRHEYALDLLREFPRLPLYRDFHHWAEMGQKLLDLHIGFESAEPYPLERHDREDVDPKRAILRADKSSGTITLDERTTLAGIPAQAWEYGWAAAPPWSGC